MSAERENTGERCWCDGSAYRPHQPGTDACRTQVAAVDLSPHDKAVQAGAFALATPGAMPEWMQKNALGRDMRPLAQIVVEGVYSVIATAVESADPFRRLLADEDRAVKVVVCALMRWSPAQYGRWRGTANGHRARLQASDVLAALREAANSG